MLNEETIGKAMPGGSKTQLPSKGRYELYDYAVTPPAAENLAVNPKNKSLLNELIAQMNAGWKAAGPNTTRFDRLDGTRR